MGSAALKYEISSTEFRAMVRPSIQKVPFDLKRLEPVSEKDSDGFLYIYNVVNRLLAES
jgi:hypothetical protein